MAESTDRHNNIDRTPINVDVEIKRSILYVCDRFLLGNFPALAVIETTYSENAFMCVVAIRFVDASDLDAIRHSFLCEIEVSRLVKA